MIAKRENSEKMQQRLQQQMNDQNQQLSHDSKRTAPLANNKVQDSQASQSQTLSQQRRAHREYGSRRQTQSQIARPKGEQNDDDEPRGQVEPSLVLDPKSGQVIDESTGRAYWLKPASN
jgi:hypothetical protein